MVWSARPLPTRAPPHPTPPHSAPYAENLEHLDLLLVGACGDSYESVPEGERHLQLAEIVQEVWRRFTVSDTRASAYYCTPERHR